MDGSCNGLQHLAALTRDPALAGFVNVLPSTDGAPRDVYSTIAEALEDVVQGHAQNGNSEAQALMRHANVIDRELLKHPVMTLSYRITRRGLEDQLLENDAVREACGARTRACVEYLAREFQSLTREHPVLANAVKLMDWFSDIAKTLGREGKPLVWATPAGMQVRLAYWKVRRKRVELLVNGRRSSICLLLEDQSQGLDIAKQARAVTASIVHSLDAAHLAMTVNACVEAGVHSFAVVHDSYGTHACDAPVMARILREQFAAVYMEPVLEHLAAQFEAQSPDGLDLPALPALGDLDVAQVVDSPYFFH